MFNLLKYRIMKTENWKRPGVAVFTLLLVTVANKAQAGVAEKFDKYILSEFTNLSGLYIIGGVLLAGIIGKLIQHFFFKDEGVMAHPTNVKWQPNRRQRHTRHVVKKTS